MSDETSTSALPGMGGLLGNLSSLSTIRQIGILLGIAASVALGISIVLWTPFQQRLERVMDIELEGFDQTIRWLELLEKRKPTNYFADDVGIEVATPKAA